MKRLIITLSVIVSATLMISLAVGLKILADQDKRAQIQPVQQAQTIKLNADTIFNLVNAERTKNGLKPLIRDARLDATAQSRADDMVARNYFSHYDPVTGESLVDIKPIVKECVEAGENISDAVNPAQDLNISVVQSWMNSKPHHDAILKADHTHAGMAISRTKVVQHFCTIK